MTSPKVVDFLAYKTTGRQVEPQAYHRAIVIIMDEALIDQDMSLLTLPQLAEIAAMRAMFETTDCKCPECFPWIP